MVDQIKMDLHIHTEYSNLSQIERYPSFIAKKLVDSRMSVQEVLIKSKEVNMSVISITDHDQIEGSLRAVELAPQYGLVAIPGMEITTSEGHILAYNIKQPIKAKMSLSETIGAIHALGGIAVGPHIFNPQGMFWGKKGKGRAKEIEGLDAIDCYSAFRGRIDIRAIKYANEKNIAVICSSDSKYASTIGKIYTTYKIEPENHIDNYKEFLKLIINRDIQREFYVKKDSNTIAAGFRLIKENYIKKR